MSAWPAQYREKTTTDEEVHMRSARSVYPEATEALRADIAGQVFIPGDPSYDQARQAWQLTVDQQPAVVVEAASTADVVAAVRFARSQGLRIAPQGTGHGAAPLEPLDSALLLRTSRLSGVRIDLDNRKIGRAHV